MEVLDDLVQDYLGSDSSTSPHQQCNGNSKSRRLKDDKICVVCGDKALGYNFDAISCESCKAFFRRNAPKGTEYFRCAYDEKCCIDYSNRRFCKSCRLKKCFSAGMRKEYILTDEEKAQKRQKILENRFQKRVTGFSSSSPPCEPSTMSSDSSSPLMPVVMDTIALPPIPPPPPPPQAHMPIVMTSMPMPMVMSSSGLCFEQAGVVSSAMPTPTLTSEDHAAIDELLYAYRKSLEINTEHDVPRDRANFSDLVNIAELSVRRVIAMAKLVSAFKAVPQPDQIQLLKGGSIELLILRSVLTFDKDKQQFLDPCDAEDTKAMKMEQLEAAESGTGLFEHHMNFVRSLAFDLRADEVTLILLLVISLFSPDRDNLVHKNLVAKEQERYSRILERYLESTLPRETASVVFPKLLLKLADIRNLNEQHSQVLLRVNPEGIQPLMKEVLDLTF